MGNGDDLDASRSVIKTYIPAYQKEIWTDHAEQLDMNQSEFVRTMVQSGRRGFELDDEGADADSAPTNNLGGNSGEFADRVVDILERDGPMDWEELVETLTDDMEERLDEAIQTLQDEQRVRHSGRKGGYTIVEKS